MKRLREGDMCALTEAPIGCTRMTTLLGYPRIRKLSGILGYAQRLKGLVRDLVSEKEGIHSARLDFLPVRRG